MLSTFSPIASLLAALQILAAPLAFDIPSWVLAQLAILTGVAFGLWLSAHEPKRLQVVPWSRLAPRPENPREPAEWRFAA
jgi:hypothetical protein